jgi:hypothetical protein
VGFRFYILSLTPPGRLNNKLKTHFSIFSFCFLIFASSSALSEAKRSRRFGRWMGVRRGRTDEAAGAGGAAARRVGGGPDKVEGVLWAKETGGGAGAARLSSKVFTSLIDWTDWRGVT